MTALLAAAAGAPLELVAGTAPPDAWYWLGAACFFAVMTARELLELVVEAP